jgi:C4-dicarboxylate transporter DctQ subunit
MEEFLLSWIVLQMAITAFLQVMVRYFWGGAITWAEELLRFEIIFVVLLGAGLGVKYDSHISVDIVQRLLPKPISKLVVNISNLFSSFGCFFLFYYSFILMLKVKSFGQTTPVLGVPKYILYTSFLFGTGLMGLRFLYLAVSGMKKGNLAEG